MNVGKLNFKLDLDSLYETLRWVTVMVIVPSLLVVVAARGGRIGITSTTGWLMTAFVAAALFGLVYSLILRVNARVGFSLAALAMLIPLISQTHQSDLAGAFLVAGAVVLVLAFVPNREQITRLIPHEVLMGMLGGALLTIELSFFPALTRSPWPVTAAVAAYFLTNQLTREKVPPILMALLAGIAVALAINPPQQFSFVFALRVPKIHDFSFDWRAILSVSIPMALGVMGALNPAQEGLRFPPRNPSIGGGLANLALSPMAGFGLWVSGDGEKRPIHVPGMVASTLGLLLAGVMASTLVATLLALPFPLLRALAALALLPIALQCLMLPLTKGPTRLGGFTAILVTAANIKWLGLSAMFWGVVIGTAVHLIGEREWKIALPWKK